ncbi:MAG: LD-carboxypeptidase [Bacteroidales bacterium]|nr:LD-carboxypeptidase [Bacteroidales bacterium]
MITPDTLKKGDSVAIISSARKITEKEVSFAKQLFKSWGLNAVLGKTIGKEDDQFAGDDILRAEDLQTMLDNSEIKAVFFARGGYGSVRILDKINWKSLANNPKWLIGYSDVTAVLMHSYYNASMSSIHGIMPINITDLSENTAVNSLKNILFNGNNEITCPSFPLNRQGRVTGEIIGGNLSVIYSLLGSNSFGDTEDKILFIEDLDEYLYHIDRMMQALKRSGKLNKIKALLVGQMSDMHDNNVPFGKTAYGIIADCLKDTDFPIAFNLPVGHIGTQNHAFIHGKSAEITISSDLVTIRQ